MALTYWLYVVCKNCHNEVVFREIPRPSPDNDLRARPVHVECPTCEFESFYLPSEIHFGIVDSSDEQPGSS